MASPTAASCTLDAAAAARNLICRDTTAAAHLKLASIFVIFLTSAVGIAGPVLLAQLFRGKPLYDKAVLVIKCFAAGVILSTSLVHVLPEAYASLADCAVSSRHPWKDFPFAGLVTLIGCLLALFVDITATEHNRCTIKPLVAALSFHQIFEGMGLGGCIAQAGFRLRTVAYMCVMFAVTTPMGILLGMIIFWLTGYDDTNPNALIMEGLLGSLSSGILVYMGLVDLIALDFFHNKLMSSTPRLKKTSFVALVLGSASMSILALWA
ncbi:unnamed protein product [Linum tenue]|uniref:Uncharacterized protein n=1 Tax=Linum tenue TaxID=586396 RepID=A0AAV0IRK9_9ROSI|nr:unnamed protein product [Linum tenue]